MSNVDVLLFTGSFMGFVRPAGAYRIATELRKNGFTVQVVDAFPQLVDESAEPLYAMIEKFVGPRTLWVGFSSTFFMNRRKAIQAVKRGWMTMAQVDDGKMNFSEPGIPLPVEELVELRRRIKARNPGCQLVFGGAKAHLRAAYIIDAYIEGYADTTVMEFTKWLGRKNPFFRYELHSPPVGVTHIEVNHDPKAAGFDFTSSQIRWDTSDCVVPGEALPIEISRGCIFNCSFCSYPLNGKKKLDFIKEPAVLIDELVRNYELYGTTQYIYSDDTHNDSVDKLEQLYDRVYSKLPFKLNFYTYLRLDLMAAHPHTIDLLLASGLRGAFFGIESLNYESAKTIGKGLRPQRAIETLHRARETWGSQVKTSAGFIVGLPHETEETASTWLEQVTDAAFPLDCAHIYPLFISDAPGSKVWKSELEQNAAKFGYKFDAKGFWYNEHLTFGKSKGLVDNYLLRARSNRKRQVSDFSLPGLLNLGYTWEQLTDMQSSDLDPVEMHGRRKAFHDQYHRDIMRQ